MTSEQFESARLFMVVAILVFRLVMMPKYLQSYLNMAYHKMEEMKKEAGKISNVELQKQIARIFYYLCVVSWTLILMPVLRPTQFSAQIIKYKPDWSALFDLKNVRHKSWSKAF